MKNNAFGILIFLTAFLIGSAAVPPATTYETHATTFHTVGEEKTPQASVAEPVGHGSGSGDSRPNWVGTPRPSLQEFRRLVTCRDKTVSLVWDELKRTEEFWEWVNPTYENTDCGGMFEAYRLDLNGDGVEEIRVRGQYGNHCGGTGNCGEWIFQRAGGSKYKLINHYGAEYFHLRKRRTNGFRDIYVTTHFSASESHHYIFRYYRGRYIEVKCWFTGYHLDGSFTSISCTEWEKQFEK